MPNVGDVRGRLALDNRPYINSLRQSGAAMNRFAQNSRRQGRGVRALFSDANGEALRFERTVKRVGVAIAAAFSVRQIAGFVQNVTRASIEISQFQLGFQALAGSIEAGNREFQFALNLSNRLGVSLETVLGNFRGLFAATRGTSLANDVRAIFTNVTTAVRTIGLGGEFASRVLNQVAQSAALGKIQTEELRSIAEAGLPAFRALADAIGVNTIKLRDLLQSGAVLSDQFLVPFTEQLRRIAGTADIFDRFDTRLVRVRNSFRLLLAAIGDQLRQSRTLNTILENTSRLFDNIRMAIIGVNDQENATVAHYQNIIGNLEQLLTVLDTVRRAYLAFYQAQIDLVGRVAEAQKRAASAIRDAFKTTADAIKGVLGIGGAQAQSQAGPQGLSQIAPLIPSALPSQLTITPSTRPPPDLVPRDIARQLREVREMAGIIRQIESGYRSAAEESAAFVKTLEDQRDLLVNEIARVRSLPTISGGQSVEEQLLIRQLRNVQVRLEREREVAKAFERIEEDARAINEHIRSGSNEVITFRDGTASIQQQMRAAAESAERLRESIRRSVETPQEGFVRRQAEILGAGLDPATQERALRQLRLELIGNSDTFRLIRAGVESVGQAFQGMFQGIVQGSQSAGEAMKRLGQNILLSLGNTALQLALERIVKLLKEIIDTARQALGRSVALAALGAAASAGTSGGGGGGGGGPAVPVSPLLRTPEGPPAGLTPNRLSGDLSGRMPDVNVIVVDDRDSARRLEEEFMRTSQASLRVVLDDINRGSGSAIRRSLQEAGR